MNFVTTNIRFPEDVYLNLKEEAFHKRKSLSAIVREKVGEKDSVLTKEAKYKIIRQLNESGASLGKKLKKFNSVKIIRQMREEAV